MEKTYKEIFEAIPNGFVEDLEEQEFIIAEAAGTGALEFFDIEVTETGLKFDKTLEELELALETVNEYFNHVEDDIPYKSTLASDYDIFTEPRRGADDGTFDYAGTFVIDILERLIALAGIQTLSKSDRVLLHIKEHGPCKPSSFLNEIFEKRQAKRYTYDAEDKRTIKIQYYYVSWNGIRNKLTKRFVEADKSKACIKLTKDGYILTEYGENKTKAIENQTLA